jgi:FdrA protein
VSDRAIVIAHVCGTPDDPQDSRRQTDTLVAAGAIVAPSNAAAARLALRALS